MVLIRKKKSGRCDLSAPPRQLLGYVFSSAPGCRELATRRLRASGADAPRVTSAASRRGTSLGSVPRLDAADIPVAKRALLRFAQRAARVHRQARARGAVAQAERVAHLVRRDVLEVH